MTPSEKETLYREAAGILLRLSEAPDDPDILLQRDAFLDRGPEERLAYGKAARVWQASSKKQGSKTIPSIALAAALLMAGFLLSEPLRLTWAADFKTEHVPHKYGLKSGDSVVLDASSAIAEDSDASARNITLLAGSAFFEVAKESRPFVVDAGDIAVEVLGTAFEVARFDDRLQISVVEGVVAVHTDASSWQLTAGQKLLWDGDGAELITEVPISSMAPWREDYLIADGHTFAHVVDVLERRLPGKIVIANQALASSAVTGGLDLSDPERALRTVAAARDARLLTVPFIGTLVLARK